MASVAACPPAPCFRKVFTCPEIREKATLYLCGLGWHKLYINGCIADDRVLAPAMSRYDMQACYIAYDVTALLQPGDNVIAVILGNGLYDCFETSHWAVNSSPWRDRVKMCCDLEVDGSIIISSDNTWKTHDTPIIYNAMRNGEYYDARLEMEGFNEVDFDDSDWAAARYCYPPGGAIVEEDMQPCRITREIAPVETWRSEPDLTVFDFGVNMTGWISMKVSGKAGVVIQLEYSELVEPVSHLCNTQEIGSYIEQGRFQKDRYTLRGNGVEEWSPSFTYHGFRYVQARIFGDAKIEEIKACFVHTDFKSSGCFKSSDSMLNALQKNTLQSFLSNFTSIPTDCPHREKNGWTGDANWAAETGLWNFDVKESFEHFIEVLVSCQRLNGQLPGVAPTGSYGYNWGNGPTYDFVLFEYIYRIYIFYGDDSLIKRFYDAMRQYMEYCRGMSNGNLVAFGLNDWKLPPDTPAPPIELIASCYYYMAQKRMAFFAELLGRDGDIALFRERAGATRCAIIEKYVGDDGIVGNDMVTALAAVLYAGVVNGEQASLIAKRLAEKTRGFGHRTFFGTIGAKFIPRVLADYGYAEDAYKLITQTELPGWGWQVTHGATSLWECWNGIGSRNHIMFGDISAWMYQYLAGVCPLVEAPGFKKVRIEPHFVKGLDWVEMEHSAPMGKIKSEWKRSGGKVKCTVELPEGCTAEVVLPGKTSVIGPGEYCFEFAEN